MAVTITAPGGPDAWLPSEEPMVFTVTTNRTIEYFLIEVLINNNSVVTLRKFPAANNSVKVDVMNIVRSFLDIPDSKDIIGPIFMTASSKYYCTVKLAVYEHYNNDDYGPTNSVPINVWNAAMPHTDMYEINHTYNWINNFTAGNGKRPMGLHNVSDTQLLYVQTTPGTRTRILLNLDLAQDVIYHQNRNITKPFTMYMPYSVYPSYYENIIGFDKHGLAQKKMITGLAPVEVLQNKDHLILQNSIDGKCNVRGTYVYPDNVTSMSDCKYIMIYYSSTYNRNLETIDTFISDPVLLELCDADEAWAITYYSQEGGWNTIQCNRRVTETTNIKTTTKENIPQMREISTVHVTAQSNYLLNTPWLNEGLNEEVKEMLLSPVIWIQHYKNGTRHWIPVYLTDNEYITMEQNSHQLFMYTLNFTEAFYKNTLR